MNKVMVASQRGALDALYGDLIDSFEFTGEEENLQKFSDDMDQLNRNMVGKAKDLLTAGQLEVFEESVEAGTEMRKSRMQMAANMFRGGKEEE